MGKYIVGITGASGAIYAERLLKTFLQLGHTIYLTVSQPGLQVLNQELNLKFSKGTDLEVYFKKWLNIQEQDRFRYFNINDVGALIASGSVKTDGMVVVPCSMSTLSSIAHGSSSNLLERAADVVLKEKRKLVIVPRETPLNAIHLKNMYELALLGVYILPAMPAFYHRPQTVDDLVNFMTGRVLDSLGLEHSLYQGWQG